MQASTSSESSLVDSFPYSSHLQTNYIPSEEEIAKIKAFLADPSEKLKKIQTNIERLKAELQAAEKDHELLESQINACYSLISLPRRLPDDVLREIFFRCLPTDGNAILYPNTPPLIFTRICSHWRQVALTTPVLWSTIHIPVIREEVDGRLFTTSSPMTPDQVLQRVIERASIISGWLQRSGAAPLCISISAIRDDHYRNPPQALFDEYIKSLRPFSMRWKSISLRGTHDSYKSLASVVEADVPSLESLFLALAGNEGDIHSHDIQFLWNSNGLLTTSSLRRLSIRDLSLKLTQLKVQWRRLTHLQLGASPDDWTGDTLSLPRLSEISGLLSECIALTSCRLYLNQNSSGYFDQNDGICTMHLPSLQRLTLLEDFNMFPLVEKLETPCLEEIEIFSNQGQAEITIPTLVAQTNENLRKLVIQAETLSNSSFLECLRLSPNLAILVLKQGRYRPAPKLRIDDDLFKLLTLQDGQPLCPRLEEFECHFQGAFTFEGFIEFIKRKQSSLGGGVKKLKKVYVLCVQEKDPISGKVENRLMLPELQSYVDDGLSFFEQTVTDHNPSKPTGYFYANAGRSSEQYEMWSDQ